MGMSALRRAYLTITRSVRGGTTLSALQEGALVAGRHAVRERQQGQAVRRAPSKRVHDAPWAYSLAST
jgi:hypothetical protein